MGNPELLREDERKLRSHSGGETVLVAEDEATVREFVRIALEGFGYRIIEAENGEEAVKKFVENAEGVDLLLLDVVMPRLNGKEAYDEIRKMRPDIRAIFVSGYTADIIHKKGVIDGELNFIPKPFSLEDLLGKIRRALDGPMNCA